MALVTPLPCATSRTIRLDFVTPAIPPANGYVVKWRAVGQTDWNELPPQFGNPLYLYNVPSCFDIEGTIQANCSGTLSNPVNFAVASASGCFQFTLTQNATYTYIPCNESTPITIQNNMSSPSTVCAVDGTVTGGTFTKGVACIA